MILKYIFGFVAILLSLSIILNLKDSFDPKSKRYWGLMILGLIVIAAMCGIFYLLSIDTIIETISNASSSIMDVVFIIIKWGLIAVISIIATAMMFLCIHQSYSFAKTKKYIKWGQGFKQTTLSVIKTILSAIVGVIIFSIGCVLLYYTFRFLSNIFSIIPYDQDYEPMNRW